METHPVRLCRGNPLVRWKSIQIFFFPEFALLTRKKGGKLRKSLERDCRGGDDCAMREVVVGHKKVVGLSLQQGEVRGNPEKLEGGGHLRET